MTRAQRLTTREYHINVLAELEEAVAYDLDKAEKARIVDMLEASDQNSSVTHHLTKLVGSLEISEPEQPGRLRVFSGK